MDKHDIFWSWNVVTGYSLLKLEMPTRQDFDYGYLCRGYSGPSTSGRSLQSQTASDDSSDSEAPRDRQKYLKVMTQSRGESCCECHMFQSADYNLHAMNHNTESCTTHH